MKATLQNIGNMPKLVGAAISLGINGLTNKSTKAEQVAAVNKMKDDVSNLTNLSTNTFYEELLNKVLISKVFRRTTFIDPLTKAFFKEGTVISDAVEIVDSKLLSPNTYDKTKRYPDQQSRAKVLNTIIKTVLQEYFTNTVSLAGVRAAFASEMAYGEFVSKQVQLLSESLQYRLFHFMIDQIKDKTKNVITLDSKITDWDETFIAINGIAENMAIPSVKYNIGFTDPTLPANKDKTRVNVSAMGSLYMIGSTNILNALKGRVSTVKFHNTYFNNNKYKAYLPIDSTDDEIFLIDRNAFEGYFRIHQSASQSWAANLSVEYFLHYWIVFGAVPWANGVRIKINAKV